MAKRAPNEPPKPQANKTIDELTARVSTLEARMDFLTSLTKQWTDEIERMVDPLSPDGLRKLFRLLAGVTKEIV